MIIKTSASVHVCSWNKTFTLFMKFENFAKYSKAASETKTSSEFLNLTYIAAPITDKHTLLASRKSLAGSRMLDSIADMLETVGRKQNNVVLMGVYSCDVLGPKCPPATTDMLIITKAHNLREIISDWTRVTGHSQALFYLPLTMYIPTLTSSHPLALLHL